MDPEDLPWSHKDHPAQLTISALRDALRDMRAGWRYIRQHHGDLPGVGWDRCEHSATKALGEEPPLMVRSP